MYVYKAVTFIHEKRETIAFNNLFYFYKHNIITHFFHSLNILFLI